MSNRTVNKLKDLSSHLIIRPSAGFFSRVQPNKDILHEVMTAGLEQIWTDWTCAAD